jgi:Peptidase family C25/Propeptide_C25/Dockerin type I domain
MEGSMKRFFILFTLMLSILLFGVDYKWDNNKFSDGLEVLSSKEDGIVLTWSTASFTLETAVINGRSVYGIVSGDEFLPNDAGFPDVPGISRMIAIPEGASVKLSYEYFNEEIIRDVEIAPAHIIPKETEDGLEYFWGKSYEQDALYPASISQVSAVDEIRGVDYVMVGIAPFRYNPVRKELHVYRDIKISISFTGGTGRFGEDRLRSRWWDPVLRGNLLNWELLPEIDYSQRKSLLRTPDYEYLIISPTGEAFITWADSIKMFRTQQGIRTGVVTLAETGSSNNQIESYINNAYNSWDIPPVAVLFLGDFGTTASNSVNSPTYNNYCISDNIFADITGNNLPDLSTARITGRNAAELELMIHKFMDYERNPPTNPGFYQNPVIAGGWQTERWFILATEVVRGFWSNVLDKNPVREYAIYSGTPGAVWSTATNTSTVVNYFGSNGLGYLGASPAVIPSWNANAASINNDINNGCFMLQHRDHGGETGWGEPDYGNSDLGGLNNEDLAFVFSTNCLTGKFNWSSECFTEAFHRHAQGALGLIAATEISYSFVNDTYIWGTYDHMWPNFDPGHGADGQNSILPCFANSSGKWFLQASNWPYNGGDKEVTYYLFHHHGDAFSTVLTETPTEIAISYPEVLLSGMTSVNVTAEAGTFICLSVGDEILATSESTGGPQSIVIDSQAPMTLVHLTATKQDHYREEADILVIPPEGAYAVVNDVEISTIDDDVIEYAEAVTMSASVENFGSEMAENLLVTISCSDQYITITDNTETGGQVAAGEVIMLADAFSFTVAEDIPDEHNFFFTAIVASDQGSWESTINLTGYAPVLEMSALSITGDSNSNGRLDPGETADLNIEILNSGGAALYNVIPQLDETDQYCTIIQNASSIAEIEAGDSGVFTYSLEVSPSASVGHVISFDFGCEADMDYSIMTSFALTVGLCLEDFESGGFSQYDWVMTGTGGWQMNTSSYEGSYCAQSVDINNSQSTGLELEVNVLNADEISFFYKVSSESGWDYLRFYIDGSQINEWSGTIDWTEYSAPVSQGIHTFKWEYSKDSSVSSGSDCAWIDYIVFPPINIPQPAEMLLDNDQFAFNLLPQSNGSADLQITNIGGGDLEWSVSKNYVSSRASGGPDNYGYQWLDSDEPNGPDFNWIDISGTGTQIVFSHNDEAEGPYPIGFNFNFYGTEYSEFIVNANGWLGFGSDNSGWSNASLPDNDGPRPAIMGFWDDLYPAIGGSGEGEAYYQSFGDYLVVMFDNVQHYPGNYNGNYTFEMIIYASGEILLQYDDVSGDTDSGTIGIQNENASDALQMTYNNNYVTDDLAIQILQVVDWLDLSQTNGTVPMGSSTSITISVDTEDLEIGNYLCNLVLNSNDPQQGVSEIPVNLMVGGDIAYGDIDDNGSVEAFDAAIVLQYFVNIDPPAAPLPWAAWRLWRADVDGNGEVEAFDASLIQQYSVGLISSFPVENPRSTVSRKMKPDKESNISLD